MSSIDSWAEAREFLEEIEESPPIWKMMRNSGRWSITARASIQHGSLAVREVYEYQHAPKDEEPTIGHEQVAGHAMRSWDILQDDPVCTYVYYDGYQIELDRFMQEVKDAYKSALSAFSANTHSLIEGETLTPNKAETTGVKIKKAIPDMIDVQNVELKYVRE